MKSRGSIRTAETAGAVRGAGHGLGVSRGRARAGAAGAQPAGRRWQGGQGLELATSTTALRCFNSDGDRDGKC